MRWELIKTLFDENERYNGMAMQLESDLAEVITATITPYVCKGYSVREISAIAHSVVQDAMCLAIMNYRDKDWIEENSGKRKDG